MLRFPGVRWNEWADMPYDLVMSCIDLIDGASDGEE